MTESNPYDLPVWETPDSYFGFDPVGDFVIIGRSRDSSIMENVNYDEVFDDLQKLEQELDIESEDGEPFVYDYRANHWAVGWVETVLIKKEAPDALQARAYETLAALADYPCIDDSKYSDAQYEEMESYWEREGLWERIQWCEEAGASIFAARVDCLGDLPRELFDHLSQSEIFY